MIRVAFASLAAAIAAAAAGSVDARQQPLVVYTRTGGFIGALDFMTVFRNGTFVFPPRVSLID